MQARNQWPLGLRRLSAATRLLGLRVRITPEEGRLSVLSVVCCQVEVSVTGRSLFQRSPTECGVSEGDRGTSTMGRPWPTGPVEPWKNWKKDKNCRQPNFVMKEVDFLWSRIKYCYYLHELLFQKINNDKQFYFIQSLEFLAELIPCSFLVT